GLVHPRKSGYSPFVQYVTEKDEKDLGPPACVRYIRRVAEVITTLDHLCDPPHVIGLSINLSSQPTVFDELIAQIGDKIGSPVSREAQSPLDLGEAAERRAMKRARTHHAASGQSSS
ncbi:MAG: hypothetical protein JWO62_2265, partial [Acidimicrobiaceae bacterium]|nr:hypothetical protein [Acidimicrobiaceae bacterium]